MRVPSASEDSLFTTLGCVGKITTRMLVWVETAPFSSNLTPNLTLVLTSTLAGYPAGPTDVVGAASRR